MDKQTHPGDCQILNNPKSVRHNYFYDYVKNNAEQIVIIGYPNSQQIQSVFYIIIIMRQNYKMTSLLQVGNVAVDGSSNKGVPQKGSWDKDSTHQVDG